MFSLWVHPGASGLGRFIAQYPGLRSPPHRRITFSTNTWFPTGRGSSTKTRARRQGLSLRAGIHTGECERRGTDLAGIGVHIGARVADLAGPDEVLVTSTVRDLTVGSGIEFDDRGHRTLKGVPGRWHLLAVREPVDPTSY